MILLSLISFAIPAIIVFGIKCSDEQIELTKNLFAGILFVILLFQFLTLCGVTSIFTQL